MSGSYLQTLMFSMNRPEPLRQASLLMLLASSVGDGGSLTESLRVHANDCGSPWSDRLHALRHLVEQGQTLSAALSSSAGLLPDSTLIAIRVAEHNGTLQNVLVDEANRLMTTTTGDSAGTQNLFGLLIWMSAVVTVATGLITFLLIEVIPKFKLMFEDFEIALPEPTVALVEIADTVVYGWPMLILPAFTMGLALIGFSIWAGILQLSRGILPFCEHWPRYWMPDVLRMLSFTVVSGHPLSSTLNCISREIRPGRAAIRLSELRTLVDSGTDCIDAMHRLKLLTTREAEFLRSAVRTRHLDWAMQHLSRAIARARHRWLDRVVTVLQPFLVAMLGAIVGFIVVSLFYPLIAILESLS